jgi:hypothetical protein
MAKTGGQHLSHPVITVSSWTQISPPKVRTWLSWQVTLSDRYIRYPPVTLKGNHLLLSTGLRVTWGKPKL